MDDVGWLWLGLFALAATSLFFSLNHLALRGFSRVKLQEAFKTAGKGDVPPAFLRALDRIMLLCLWAALAADVGVVLLLVHLLSDGPRSLVLAGGISFVLLAVVHGLLPHVWARYTAEALLLRTHRLLGVLALALAPLGWLGRRGEAVVRRLAGADNGEDEDRDQRQEEFLTVVEQGHLDGVVDAEEMEMIENVLELSETTAEEIMTPRTDVVALNVNDDRQTVLETISQAGHSRIPVYEGDIDHIVGLVYAKDLLTEVGRTDEEFRLRDKIRPAYFVPESKPLRSLLHEFQNQKLHIAVVLDEYGGTAGIVTIEDILEELVGEIADEYEPMPVESMQRLDEHTIEIDARTYVDDLNDEFDVTLPEDDDYDTVGGFVFSHLGYIPKTGETFEYGNLRFTIIAAEERKINRIRIEKKPVGDLSGAS